MSTLNALNCTLLQIINNIIDANDITNEAKKRGIQLNACDRATYKLVRNFATLTKLIELEYTDLITNHVAPKLSIILERLCFTHVPNSQEEQ